MASIFMTAWIAHQQSVMPSLNLIITALVPFMQLVREHWERAFHSNCMAKRQWEVWEFGVWTGIWGAENFGGGGERLRLLC